MKALVVGGAGFIGSHLCRALLERKINVVCVDNLSLGVKANIECFSDRNDFVFYEADASEMDIMEEIFQRERVRPYCYISSCCKFRYSNKCKKS